MKKMGQNKLQVSTLVGLTIAAAGVASSCKQQFNTAGRLKDSGTFAFPSPVSASINISASGWLMVVEDPAWVPSVISVNLGAPVEGTVTAQGEPGFVGPPAPNAPATFEFAPTQGLYTAQFSLRATDGSNRSANCQTQAASALNLQVPAASIKCDKDLLGRPDSGPNSNNPVPDQQQWSQKIADQVLLGSGGAQAISFAISFMGGEQIPVDIRNSWQLLENEVNAIASRYAMGGNPFEEVLNAVQLKVRVSNPAALAQKLLDGRNQSQPPQTTTKSCVCQVSECDDVQCAAPVSQAISGITTEAACKAKSGTSSPGSSAFLGTTTEQYAGCEFK